MSLWIPVLASVGVVSALPLLALPLVRGDSPVSRLVPSLLSLAVGALLGSALLELLPESFAHFGIGRTAPLLVLGGFFGFFVLEKLLRMRHAEAPATRALAQPFTLLNLVGDTTHNVIDGMVIAASYVAGGTALGLATTAAVVLHEIPHELGDIGVLVHGGITPRSAVWLNCATGVGAMLGAIAVLLVGAQAAGTTAALLPIAAGNFLYVAAADLIPELHGEHSAAGTARQVVTVLAGVLLVSAPELLR